MDHDELIRAAKAALERLEKYTDGMVLLPGPHLAISRRECAWNLRAAIASAERGLNGSYDILRRRKNLARIEKELADKFGVENVSTNEMSLKIRDVYHVDGAVKVYFPSIDMTLSTLLRGRVGNLPDLFREWEDEMFRLLHSAA